MEKCNVACTKTYFNDFLHEIGWFSRSFEIMCIRVFCWKIIPLLVMSLSFMSISFYKELWILRYNQVKTFGGNFD